MTRQPFEHVVRHDVHNNAIVREVDRTRQRELGRWGVIGVLVVSGLLFLAWQHFEFLQHGYELDRMQQDWVRELEINRHLRLEIEALRAPARIERIATGQLGFVAPGGGDVVVLERAPPPAETDRPLVAARAGETFDAETGRP